MNVWVISTNTTERALIVALLTEEGFEARGFDSVSELMMSLAEGQSPQVLVLDAGEINLADDEWNRVKMLAPAAQTILITGLLPSPLAADQVLRRPFSIGELVSKIGAKSEAIDES